MTGASLTGTSTRARRFGEYVAEPLTLALVALVSAMFVVQRASGVWSGNVTHLQHTLCFSLHGLANGELWRILTPNLTNGPTGSDFGPPGFAHLVFNVAGLLAFGPIVERALGKGRFAAVAIVGGAAAYGWLVIPLPQGDFFDGTSGIVYAFVGAALVAAIRSGAFRPRHAGVALLALFVLSGVVGKSAVTVDIHLGGFVAGCTVAAIADRLRSWRSVTAVTVAALCALMLLVTLRHSAISAKERELHPRDLPRLFDARG